MSGYPEESIVKKGEKKTQRFFCYSMAGQVEMVEAESDGKHLYAAHSIDCSPGQDGGPLTLKDGTVVGVYSNVEDYGTEQFYFASVINKTFLTWFDSMFPEAEQQISSFASPPAMVGF
jgi:V8-like Glu-specific endopeptidase